MQLLKFCVCINLGQPLYKHKVFRHREQCIRSMNRANRVLRFITRSIILRPYLVLVRPHLDCALQFWSPYYKMDIDKPEAVHRRVTKNHSGDKELNL